MHNNYIYQINIKIINKMTDNNFNQINNDSTNHETTEGLIFPLTNNFQVNQMNEMNEINSNKFEENGNTENEESINGIPNVSINKNQETKENKNEKNENEETNYKTELNFTNLNKSINEDIRLRIFDVNLLLIYLKNMHDIKIEIKINEGNSYAFEIPNSRDNVSKFLKDLNDVFKNIYTRDNTTSKIEMIINRIIYLIFNSFEDISLLFSILANKIQIRLIPFYENEIDKKNDNENDNKIDNKNDNENDKENDNISNNINIEKKAEESAENPDNKDNENNENNKNSIEETKETIFKILKSIRYKNLIFIIEKINKTDNLDSFIKKRKRGRKSAKEKNDKENDEEKIHTSEDRDNAIRKIIIALKNEVHKFVVEYTNLEERLFNPTITKYIGSEDKINELFKYTLYDIYHDKTLPKNIKGVRTIRHIIDKEEKRKEKMKLMRPFQKMLESKKKEEENASRKPLTAVLDLTLTNFLQIFFYDGKEKNKNFQIKIDKAKYGFEIINVENFTIYNQIKNKFSKEEAKQLDYKESLIKYVKGKKD